MEWTFQGVMYGWSPEWFDAWAGWAQAIATAVALGLALKQGYDAAARERAQANSVVHTAWGALGAARMAVVNGWTDITVEDDVEGAARALLESFNLRSSVQLLLNFDLTRLAVGSVAMNVLEGQEAVLEFYRAIEEIARGDLSARVEADRAEVKLTEAWGRVFDVLTEWKEPWWRRLFSIGARFKTS